MSGDIKEFEVLEVELEGKNAIEASAGTGKTFSIAVLVLRLLLEKKIPIEEILMVTFTKAAVAELSERIRIFVRDALNCAKGENPQEKIVKEVVDKAIKNNTKEEVEFLLKKAVAFLDETSIFTIHSFCQRTLNEFAFETGEIFDATIITDESEIINNAVFAYWRKEITPLDKEILEVLTEARLSLEILKTVIKESLNGKIFALEKETSLDDIEKSKQNIKDLQDNEIYILKENLDDVLSRMTTALKRKEVGNFVSNYSAEIKNPFVKKDGTLTKYFSDNLPLTHPIIKFYEDLAEAKPNYEKALKNLLHTYYNNAINYCKEQIEDFKKKHSLITQNDFINHLFDVVKNEDNKHIAGVLQQKYQAFFIDEFQDTDKKQYKIFTELFPSVISFYIGDPKQSIYGFRGADLDSYQEAINDINEDKKFTMKQNFRANQKVVDAMNVFFAIDNPFLDEYIKYIEVSAGKNMENLTKNGVEETPFTILQIGKDEKESRIVAKQINELLSNNYKIGEKDFNLKNFSIGVLTRNKNQGKEVKKALSRYGINSVLINEAKVVESDAVGDFLFFLECVIEPTSHNIKKALLSCFIEKDIKEISTLSQDELIKYIEFFRKQFTVYKESGIFVMCQNILNFFNLKKDLLAKNKQRELSNASHFIELLNKKEKNGASSIEELIGWAKRVRSGLGVEGDEFIERVESDETAVEIATIHSSKGLAYDIVFAPYLNQSGGNNNFIKTVSYKKDGEKYFSLDKKGEGKGLEESQNGIEHRRLIYVAITRAKYKVFVIEKETNTDVGAFIDMLKDSSKERNLFDIKNWEKIESVENNFIQETEQKSYHKTMERYLKPVSFSKSFSSLNGVEHAYIPVDNKENKDYDKFIFETIGKGSTLGTFLHEIYENIDFTNSEKWKFELEKLGRKNQATYKSDSADSYIELIENTMEANLKTGFKLKDISLENRLIELEFYFNIQGKTSKIEEYLQQNGFPQMKIKVSDIDGAINGFIDLLFEHKGKYYILDWKSNHIGNSVECYDENGVEEAMTHANYHLQYLLYGVATKRFLESKGLVFQEVFGGVLYLFLRGLRTGKTTGVLYKSAEECTKIINGLDEILLKEEE